LRIGVICAFFVQCIVAVAFGRLIGLAPDQIVKWLVVALFLVGAAILFRSARKSDDGDAETDAVPNTVRSGFRAVAASFLVLFAAEWGDLSQLLTAGLVAKGNPKSISQSFAKYRDLIGFFITITQGDFSKSIPKSTAHKKFKHHGRKAGQMLFRNVFNIFFS